MEFENGSDGLALLNRVWVHRIKDTVFEVRKANVVEEEAERKMKLRVMWASLGARPKVGSGEARRSEDIRRDKKRQIEKDRRDEDRRRDEERQRERTEGGKRIEGGKCMKFDMRGCSGS